ncbi:MAG TPA: hypothetical protein VFW73_04350 [Lacipirellulaceae bacterium]|nr:hypothetical protein [Lacipirellulaceae bacterium]
MNHLDELKQELGRVFGRLDKWRACCTEQNATTLRQQMKLAEEVLAEPCSGTVAEARTHALTIQGVKTMKLGIFLGDPKAHKAPRRRRS